MKDFTRGRLGEKWRSIALLAVLALVTWAWISPVAVAADAAGPRHAPAAGDSSAVFVLYGMVFREDGTTPWPYPDTLVVRNERTLAEERVVLGSPYAGGFALTFVDLGASAAVAVDDVLSFDFTPSFFPLSPDAVVLDWLDVTRGCREVALRALESASGADGRINLRTLRIDIRPNPSSGQPVQLELRFGRPGTARGRLTLAIQDAAGRVVRRLAVHLGGSERVSVPWDGRDESGRTLAPGVYWVHPIGAGAGSAGRAIRVD
jgi:hypothetical protein